MTAAAEHGLEAIDRRRMWRVEAAMGAVIRDAMARAGIDAAIARRLRLADEAAAALTAIPDTPELRHADARNDASAHGYGVRGDAFMPKILAMAQRFTDGLSPDFANASFAELFAWSLTQYSERRPQAPAQPSPISEEGRDEAPGAS